MKKWIALLLSVVLLLSLVGCGSHADAYLDLDKSLRDTNYTTEVTVGGSSLDSAIQQLGLSDVKAAASISFMKNVDNVNTSGFAYVFSFADKETATAAFAAILKMYLSSGVAFQTVESENGNKAIYQDGTRAMNILTQSGHTVIYSSEYWKSVPKNDIYDAGLGKILEDLGY